MLFSKAKKRPQNPQSVVTLEKTTVEIVNSVTRQGIVITSRLNFM